MADIKKLQKKYQDLLDKDYPEFVIGVDECGKGSWAGPMIICGMAWFPWHQLPEMDDSKKLSRSKIRHVANVLRLTTDIPWIMAIIKPEQIDRDGIEDAWHQGVAHVIQMLRLKYDEHGSLAVVDGNKLPKYDAGPGKVVAMPKADSYCPAVQAAAIMAKNQQLQEMMMLDEMYPGYGFEENAGYGTAAHRTALKKLGKCPAHRSTFRPMKDMKGG